MIDRPRGLVAALALGLLTALGTAEAQPTGKVPRIGFLWMNRPIPHLLDAFRQGLRDLDRIEGQSIIVVDKILKGAKPGDLPF